ncbi:hypothetical protein FN846DRAFT_887577 [Sphaerosporella brunnea]|uniref:Uncharacterized protein n=1 Tax=Sphaerosporella brunnea TaxID=1250544 RepID=A0A5J5F678_9PEZI|nr:hypothetical protein FN846DRAFT_887577 [Sphaerosporella brunnea]
MSSEKQLAPFKSFLPPPQRLKNDLPSKQPSATPGAMPARECHGAEARIVEETRVKTLMREYVMAKYRERTKGPTRYTSALEAELGQWVDDMIDEGEYDEDEDDEDNDEEDDEEDDEEIDEDDDDGEGEEESDEEDEIIAFQHAQEVVGVCQVEPSDEVDDDSDSEEEEATLEIDNLEAAEALMAAQPGACRLVKVGGEARLEFDDPQAAKAFMAFYRATRRAVNNSGDKDRSMDDPSAEEEEAAMVS